MPMQATAVILAGGRSRRLGGVPKPLLTIGAETILARLTRVLETIFSELILVTNEPLRYLSWPGQIVTDLVSVRSSLTGLHTGLYHANGQKVFVSAGDTPFLCPPLVDHLLALSGPRWDVVLPRSAGGFEPLCAVYDACRLLAVQRQLLSGEYKIQRLFRPGRTRVVEGRELQRLDPTAHSFFNVNTPDDLLQAQRIAHQLPTAHPEPDGHERAS